LKEKRRDNKGRVLHTGESQRKDGITKVVSCTQERAREKTENTYTNM